MKEEYTIIVRELAERGPFTYDRDGILFCALCGVYADAATEPERLSDSEDHRETCLWRRSKRLHEQSVDDRSIVRLHDHEGG